MSCSSRSAARHRFALVLALGVLLSVGSPVAAPAIAEPSTVLPPAMGADAPPVEPSKGDDGIYHQKWFVQSFFDLREDFAEAKAKGKRLAIIFEQRGCIYCVKMHTEVLKKRYINDYVRENFAVIQFDMWGAREVTDFDGEKMPEKKLAERWGIMFTPTVIFFKEDIDGLKGQWGAPLEVARMNLGIGPGTFYDMFTWVRAKVYEKDRNFQRFHLERYAERERLEKERATGKDKVN
ncbi:MAG: thioredoxin family protein [Hyphomicrobiaceae bacterium]